MISRSVQRFNFQYFITFILFRIWEIIVLLCFVKHNITELFVKIYIIGINQLRGKQTRVNNPFKWLDCDQNGFFPLMTVFLVSKNTIFIIW